MRRILFTETDFSTLPNPPAGFKYIGFNGPTFTEKDDTGLSTPTGGGGGSASFTEITYQALKTLQDRSELTPGGHYLITDFKTCYDQPDYDSNGSPTFSAINYKVSEENPILVFTISANELAADAYQPNYPKDEIKYDISFNTTEVTGGTAYGRITYRKDDNGNAFDYDFREVLFKRYDAYVSEQVYDGLVSITENIAGTYSNGQEVITGVVIGVVTGVDTNFSFATGSVVGVLNIDNNDTIVNYYEVLEVLDGNNMVVTGNTIVEVSNTRLVDSNLLEGMSWKQNNIISNTTSYEYLTFENYESSFNNISINNSARTEYREDITFILPNNVFRSSDDGPYTYLDNLFGSDFRNNTFYDDCDSNIIRDDFYNNIITNDFDHNTVTDSFYNNIIDCDFTNNIVNGSFYNNHFGDADEEDFDYNIIDAGFYNNFYTGENDFEYNTIKGGFYKNIILNRFSRNTLSGVFRNNIMESTFRDNKIGDECYSNYILEAFSENVTGDYFYDNEIFGSFTGNVIGNNFFNNNLYANAFEDNQISTYFHFNNIGDSGNGTVNNYRFYKNTIGHYFSYNTTLGGDDEYFDNNEIGNDFSYNNVYGEFEGNFIGNGFNNNNIGSRFNDNKIGNNFNYNNRIGINFKSNVIGNYFESNRVGNNFERNRIGDAFASNQIDNGLFDWGELNNLVDREYDTFQNALDNNIDEYVVGENLILKDTVNDEYYKVKFTQWTQNSNGGGFSYERTKVNPTTGDNIGDTVYFTKPNGATSSVDIIVPGVLEITRGDGGIIYNSATESNADLSSAPTGTQWNSRFLASNNGALFQDNNIKNDFQNNNIYQNFEKNNIESSFKANWINNAFFENTEVGNYFHENTIGRGLTSGYIGDLGKNKIGNSFQKNFLPGNFVSNVIGNNFYSNEFIDGAWGNTIKNDFYNNDIEPGFDGNEIGNYFEANTIGQSFQGNNIKEGFYSNVIAQNFAYNTIENAFVENNIESDFGFGYGELRGNRIGNSFQSNHVGEYFYDNNISDNFIGNTMSHNFRYNDVKTRVNNTDFSTYNGNILAFTYSFTGELPGTHEGMQIFGNTFSGISGTYSYGGATASVEAATFDIYVTELGALVVTLNNPGKHYLPSVGTYSSIITISESLFANGYQYLDDSLVITITGTSDLPSVYGEYNTEIFTKVGGVNRLSYYDSSDILTITDIDK